MQRKSVRGLGWARISLDSQGSGIILGLCRVGGSGERRVVDPLNAVCETPI